MPNDNKSTIDSKVFEWTTQTVKDLEAEIERVKPLCGRGNTIMPHLTSTLAAYRRVLKQYELTNEYDPNKPKTPYTGGAYRLDWERS